MKRRRAILIAGLIVLLWVLAGLSYGYMSAQRSDAQAATLDLTEGIRLMDQAQTLARRPALALEREKLACETTSLIEAAARSVGISPGSVRRFSYDGARRLGDTVFKEKATQVLLQPVTLRQLVDLAIAISTADAGLNVETIRLSIPREGGGRDLWTAEVVLTYLIYDPPGKQEPSR
jgi:hypothetical protein